MDDEGGSVGTLEHYSEVEARFQTSGSKTNFEIGGEAFINHFSRSPNNVETFCLQFSKSLLTIGGL